MAYLGRQPIIGNYQVLDALTATATDTYALTKGGVAVFPQTPANCIVSLNGVIQAPFSSYNISGSNIVFASALTGSDSIDFITVLGDVLNVGTVSDGTITPAKMDLSQNYTFTGAVSGHNYPAFEVYLNSNQSISASTYTKVQYNTEILDTDSCFDNSTNYRFTPTVSGYYYLEAQIMLVNSSADFQSFNIRITKNGSDISNIDRNFAGTYFDAGAGQGLNVSVISQANGSTDYFEVQGISSGTSSVFYGTTGTSFRGYRIGA
jgi:hypothetical protein